jgi:hypothetical protein
MSYGSRRNDRVGNRHTTFSAFFLPKNNHLSTPYKPPVAYHSCHYYHGIWFDAFSVGWGFGFMAEAMSVCPAWLKSAFCDEADLLDDVKYGAFRL